MRCYDADWHAGIQLGAAIGQAPEEARQGAHVGQDQVVDDLNVPNVGACSQLLQALQGSETCR